MAKADYKIQAFESAEMWRNWLVEHHTDTDGLWLRLYKKASGVATVTYAQALDHALCFGWIDGQVKKYDDESYLQKFTPRRKASLWSKRNIEYIGRLTEAGLMTPAGQAEVDRAKADGRWAAAYDKPSEMTMPDYFTSKLDEHPQAQMFFDTLNKTSKYAIAWKLQTAKKEETRINRMSKIIAMLEAGQKPQ